MATVVRLKRKLTEEPTEKLIISSKRAKDSVNHGEEMHRGVFRLAATVKTKDEAELRNALGHNEANSGAVSNTAAKPVKRKTVQNKTFTRKKAFSVINQQHIDLNKLSGDTLTGACSSEGAVVPSDVCLYDAVINDGQSNSLAHSLCDKEIPCNGEAQRHVIDNSMDEDGYVYDIFYLDSTVDGPLDHQLFENILCIEAFGEDYAQFADYRHDRIYDDDNDDSNDEDNWRNDYPDENEGDSDDMDREYADGTDDITDVLRFDNVRLASSEGSSSDDDVPKEFKFTENKSFESYYKSYKKSTRVEGGRGRGRGRGRGVGECNTSSEEEDEDNSDGCDDLY